MLNIILVISGILMHLYSAYLSNKINSEIGKRIMKKTGLIQLLFILVFIIGYALFLFRLLEIFPDHSVGDTYSSLIFFFGAIFVVVVVKTNSNLLFILSGKSKDLELLNFKLKRSNLDLGDKTSKLQASEKNLQEKAQELESTLEDFYTLRLSMEEDIKKGVLEKENKMMKKRLDSLKNK